MRSVRERIRVFRGHQQRERLSRTSSGTNCQLTLHLYWNCRPNSNAREKYSEGYPRKGMARATCGAKGRGALEGRQHREAVHGTSSQGTLATKVQRSHSACLDADCEGGAGDASPQRRRAEHQQRQRGREEQRVHFHAERQRPEHRRPLPDASLRHQHGHVGGEHRNAVVEQAENVDGVQPGCGERRSNVSFACVYEGSR